MVLHDEMAAAEQVDVTPVQLRADLFLAHIQRLVRVDEVGAGNSNIFFARGTIGDRSQIIG